MTDTTKAAPRPSWIERNYKAAIAGALGAMFAAWLMGSYNGLIARDTTVQEASANVSTLYQRRANLIPNLVQAVQAAGFNERDTLTAVQDARSKATQITVDASKATPEQIARMQAAQGELSAALGRLMMVREAYPDLKTNQNFLQLQSQIEGTENRIQVGQQRYNGAVGDFNRSLRSFPSNIVNGAMAHLEPYAMFKEQAGAEVAPTISFQRK